MGKLDRDRLAGLAIEVLARSGDEIRTAARETYRDLFGVPYIAITPRDQKVLARTRVASTIGTMRVHYQQLTEPIARLLDNDLHELFDRDAKFLIPTQLKSLATRSRRLPPRAIRSSQSTLP